ncbi:MAG: RNA polymerase-associated protein RapA, partial [Verrucomicrobiota bacterium]
MVLDADADSVEIEFAATGEKLRYAASAAPLRRVRFGLGDEIESWDGCAGTVEEVRETPDGLLDYRIDSGSWIEEADLAAHLSEERHDDALFAGRCGTTREFALRRRVLRACEKRRSSEVRGLLGAKVDLIPHQLFIAKTVAGRSATRVLLADEVGLGKTIEACLIMHRRMIAGRVSRVLVLVPEALVHQWFVELLRRFNLQFSIFDEDRCRAIESGGEGTDNPFLEEQIVLASTPWLATAKGRPEQAAAANWDMVVVDEAHHLQWSPDEESAEYRLVRQLAESTRDVLLLTATPEQLGREGHFARLQLLDPQRFSNLEDYLKERDGYAEVADLAAEVIAAKKMDEDLTRRVKKVLGDAAPKRRETVVERLIDMHGTGRVMFRNVRSNLGGFPARKAHLIPLPDGDANPGFGEELAEEDPRVDWLAGFLKDHPKKKVLVIGSTRELAEGFIEAIQAKVLIKCAIFHEGLTLLQRDRNAAWFAEDDGARVLVCSEIGSEGRNFHFAHDIVLLDLPTRPGLVEQRIGRLDRIGQTETIQIHLPFSGGSAHEGVARWYQDGCNAFEQSLRGGSNVREQFEAKIIGMRERPAAEWTEIIEETREFVDVLDEKLEEGRDRLLEMASFRRAEAEAVTDKIRGEDEESALDKLFVDLCDQLGVAVEPLDATSITMKADTVFSGEAFPGMRDGPTPGTFSRAQALEREEMSFLTWDHP